MTTADEYRWDQSPAQKARNASRGLSGEFAVHSEDLIELAQDIGEKIHDENGRYIGLTHKRIAEILREVHTYRTVVASGDQAVLVDALNARTEEIALLRVRLGTLRRWLNDHTKLVVAKDEDAVDSAIMVLDSCYTMAKAMWPHLQTMWGNVVHVLRQAGLIAHPNTGDIYPVDKVSERPK